MSQDRNAPSSDFRVPHSNFSFLPPDFRTITESATKAEAHIMGDPRAACFHARFALEAIVHWLYRHDAGRMAVGRSLEI